MLGLPCVDVTPARVTLCSRGVDIGGALNRRESTAKSRCMLFSGKETKPLDVRFELGSSYFVEIFASRHSEKNTSNSENMERQVMEVS